MLKKNIQKEITIREELPNKILTYAATVDYKNMWNFLNEILMEFRSCFSRKASFKWFVVIIIGLMIRSDKLGVTSIVRDLCLADGSYIPMLNFFRANSWILETLIIKWCLIIKEHAPICREDGLILLAGDGVKQPKEGKKMPGVKKLHQESENSSKAEYIFGHMFGCVGVLIGNASKMFCTPVSLRIHDGIQTIKRWCTGLPEVMQDSHVVQMISDGFSIAKAMGESSLLLLDRYFLSVPALIRLDEVNEKLKDIKLHILVKVKKSYTAYAKPPEKKKGKGRNPKKGPAIKLINLFETKKAEFTKTTLNLYGKEEIIEYFCINLLWGKKLYKELRFVLVKYGSTLTILATTKLDLDPLKVIKLYSYRFKIECTFRELKQVIGGFCYHFWTKSMPKLNRFAKKGDKSPLEDVVRERSKQLIVAALKAIEGYVMFACIAIGALQIMSIKFSTSTGNIMLRFLRTQTNIIVSEATVAYFLRKNIFQLIYKHRNLAISVIIKSKFSDDLMEDTG